MVATTATPRLMHIGGGALAELPGVLRRLELVKPLIVTDPFLAKSGHLDRATAILDRAGVVWRCVSRDRRGPDNSGCRSRRLAAR
jgi:alcohol dehydrogenase class IV